MEGREYDRMREVEDRHWWYRGLHELVLGRLEGRERVLDAGCGTGGMLRLLPARPAVGLDLSPVAMAHCRGRGLSRLVRGTTCALPFATGAFQAVLALDVLYHRSVEDQEKALEEFFRVLEPGGLLILHLPAFDSLAGAHDRAVHGARRYTRRQVGELVRGAGLSVTELSFRNLLALAAALVVRPLRRGGGKGEAPPPSDLRPLPRFLDGLLLLFLRAENAMLARFPLPVGLSVWCVARKPA